MASIVVNNGLQRIGVQASQATSGAGPTYNASRHIQTMSVDDQSSAFLATDVDLDRAGGLTVTNEYDAAFDSAPTRANQTITHRMTIPVGSGNFTIRRIALHDDTAANVTTASDTLVAGIDGQSLAKTSDFTIEFTVNITYSDAS